MPSVSEFINALIGGKAAASAQPNVIPEPESHTTLAPSLTSWPTSSCAAEARKYGFGYESGVEPYVQGNAARVFGTANPQVFDASGKRRTDLVPAWGPKSSFPYRD